MMIKKDQFPVGPITELLADEGNDLMFLADSQNQELMKKVEALTPQVMTAFDNFSKEVSLAADMDSSKIKIKTILIVTQTS